MSTILLALGWAVGPAWAGPGDHIRVGSVEVVPDVDVGAEVRSNVFRTEDGAQGAGNLLLSPGLKLTADGARHTLRMGGDWTLRKFLFVGRGDLTDEQAEGLVSRLDRFNDATGNLSLDAFKRSAVGLRLSDQISFRNWNTDAPLADVPYSSHLRNALRGALRINPASALTILAGGQWTHEEFFTPVEGQEEPLNVRDAYGPTLEARYAFLPRTSLVLRGTYTINEWQNNSLASDSADDGGLTIADSSQLKVLGGLDGQLTEKIFVTLMGGYGIAPYDPESVPGTIATQDLVSASPTGGRRVLLKGQVRYDIRAPAGDLPGTKVSVGYVRDFRDSFFTNWVGMDQVTVRFDGRIWRFLPSASAAVAFESYFGEISRNDVMHRYHADVGYRLREYAVLKLGGWWHRRDSSDPTADYDDVNVHLMATFRY